MRWFYFDRPTSVTFDAWHKSERDAQEENKGKGKEEYLYSAFFGQGGTLKALRHGSHSFTCK